MNMERDLHMASGEGEASYVNNSRLQLKALLETEEALEKAVREVYMDLLNPAMTVVDLGCSSGQNTLFFVSKVIKVVSRESSKRSGCHIPVELQVFLNDLPGNDFNHVFRSLERFKKRTAAEHEENATLLPFYIAGLPGSYYTRLFPRHSCHLFHSSYCLHWRSQVPAGLGGAKEYINKGNVYIAKTTPPGVVELYRRQFQEDMLLFFKLRHEELVLGGQMVLTFHGRKFEDLYNNGYLDHPTGLLSRALQSLVEQGRVEKEKLNSFDLPFYMPSVNEVESVVAQSELFHISHIKLFETNWDPNDDSEGDEVHSYINSGINIAKCLRAVFGPLLSSHFGEYLMDELFDKYAYHVAQQLEKEKGKYLLICLSLKRT